MEWRRIRWLRLLGVLLAAFLLFWNSTSFFIIFCN